MHVHLQKNQLLIILSQICYKDINLLFIYKYLWKGEDFMKIVAKAKTTAKSYAKKKNVANAGCDHIKCKLCEY